MINLNGKRFSDLLITRVESAGHQIFMRDGVAQSSDDAAVQQIVDAFDELAAFKEERLSEIRAEAKRRIEEKYPDWLQRNMTARSAELIDLRAVNEFLTAEEEAERIAIKAVWDGIKAVRSASNDANSSIDAAATVEAVEAVAVDWPDL